MDFDFNKIQVRRNQRLSIFAFPAEDEKHKDPHARRCDIYAILSAIVLFAIISCVAILCVYSSGTVLQVAQIPIVPREPLAQNLTVIAPPSHRFTAQGLTVDDFDPIRGSEYTWQLIYQGPCAHDDIVSLATFACEQNVNSILLDTGTNYNTAACLLALNEDLHGRDCLVSTGFVYTDM